MAADAPLEPSDVFSAITDYLGGHPELVEKTKTVFQFNLKNPDSQWFLDLKNGAGACGQAWQKTTGWAQQQMSSWERQESGDVDE